MGSKGTGTFTDYPGSQGGRPGGGGGSGGGGSGGKGGDQCDKKLTRLALEEVANSEYYEDHETVPRINTQVRLRKKLVNRRVAVETSVNEEVVGYVPTTYNYLRACMTDGWEYSGNVVDSSAGQIPKVKVELNPSHE